MKCSIDGCERVSVAKMLCWKHYLRQRRHGDTTTNQCKNRGNKRYNSDRYVMIHLGGNAYKAKHVLLAEKALGRPLPAGVEVHHVDGDGFHNAPSNLVVCPDHAYHLLLHRRARMLGYEPPVGKLSYQKAAEIRASALSARVLAEIYGVSKSSIKAIRAGRLFKV